jgi:AP-3 complex subunit mu
LTVSGLSLAGEAYRPYKGVRNVTKSGLYQVRYS